MAILETIISASITGIGAGLGTSVGTYFSNKLIIKHLDKIEKKIKVSVNGKKRNKTTDKA